MVKVFHGPARFGDCGQTEEGSGDQTEGTGIQQQVTPWPHRLRRQLLLNVCSVTADERGLPGEYTILCGVAAQKGMGIP